MRFLAAAFIAAFTITTAPAFAAEAFKFDDAFVRETPVKISAGYVAITNTGAQDDTLLGASADWADKIEMHDVKTDHNGVMSMMPLTALSIRKDETQKLSPSGRHMMIFGVKEKLVAGQTRDITLNFAKAGKINVPFTVQPITYRGKDAKSVSAKPATDHAMDHMNMDDMDHGNQ